jgi:L,D-peptidoglycan transpeptidase YkuD (ErfK/YbiS/YcfS/YnhG family)
MLGGSPAISRAAAFRRRPFLHRVVSLAALAAALQGCGREVPFDVAGARAVAHRAADRLAPHSPRDAERIKSLIELANGITAREQRASFWESSPGTVEAAWGRTLDAAATALLELRSQRLAHRQSWAELEPRVTKAVARAREESEAAGLGRHEAKLVEQAELALALARRLAAQGATARAIREGDLALARAAEVRDAWEDLHRRFSDRASLRRWRAMVEETLAESARRGTTVFIVDKLRRRLDVYVDGQWVADFPVELGARGLRQKLHAGDKATPEGRYRVVEVRSNGQTRYYKALLLDYPNGEDRVRFAEGRQRGWIPRGVGVGSLIEIHGDGGKGKDWTDGCIALSNDQMDRLFRYARVNTPVTIVGTVPEEVRAR